MPLPYRQLCTDQFSSPCPHTPRHRHMLEFCYWSLWVQKSFLAEATSHVMRLWITASHFHPFPNSWCASAVIETQRRQLCSLCRRVQGEVLPFFWNSIIPGILLKIVFDHSKCKIWSFVYCYGLSSSKIFIHLRTLWNLWCFDKQAGILHHLSLFLFAVITHDKNIILQ